MGKEIDEQGESLNDVEESLNKIGIALRTSENEWRDYYEVLDEIGNKWSSLSSLEQSQVTTSLGGTRQREQVATLLENWNLVKKYADIGANSAGTAMEKYDIVLDSVSAKQEQLTAKVQEFYASLLDSGVITGILDIGKGLMDFLNLGDGLVGKILILTTITLGYSAVLSHLTDNGKKTFAELIAGFIGLSTTEGAATANAGLLKVALDLLNAHPIILTLSTLIAVVTIGVTVFKAFNVTLEEQHEKAQQAQQDYQSIVSELEQVNSELQTTRDRIDELNSKDKLTFAEKDELEKLQQTNAELEKRQYWLDMEAQRKQQDVIKEASDAWDKDFNRSGEYKSRYDTVDDGSGAQVKVDITENEYIQEQIQYYNELEQKIQELSSKRSQWTEQEKSEYDSLISEQENVTNYLQSVGSRIQKDFIDAYDVDDATKQKWLDLQNVIFEALNPPTREERLIEIIDELPKKFQNALKKGNLKDLEEAFAIGGSVDTDALGAFQAKLDEIGISADEVIDYLNSLAEATNQMNVTPLLSYSEVINSVKDKCKALGDAQKEMSDSGYLTYDTVLALEKEFGNLEQYLTTTANGYKISKEGIDALNSSMTYQYEVALNEAQTAAVNVLNQEGVKESSYEKTTEAILKQLEARLALARAEGVEARSEFEKLGISKAGLKDFKPYQQASAKEQEIQKVIDNLKNSQANLDRVKKSINSIVTTTASKGSKSGSSSSTTDALTKLKEAIEALERPADVIDKKIKAIGSIDTIDELNKQYSLLSDKLKIVSNNLSVVQSQLKNNNLSQEQREYLEDKLYEYQTEIVNIQESFDKIKLDKLKLQLEDLQNPIDDIDNKIKQLGDINTVQEKAKESELLAQKFKLISNNISIINKLLKDTTLSKDMRELLEKELQNLLVDQIGIKDDIESNIKESIELEKENAELQAKLDYKKKLYELELELYGLQGKDLYEHQQEEEIKRLQEIIDARESEKDIQDEIAEEQEYQNRLLEAKINLQNALNNKTIKILTKQEDGTWQYEYSANMKDVKDAQDELNSIQKEYDEWKYDRETDRIQSEIDIIQKEIDTKNEMYKDMEFHLDQSLEAQTNAIEQYYADIEKITQDRMSSYQDKYKGAWDKVIAIAQERLDKLSALNTKLEAQSEYAFEVAKTDNTYVKKVQSFDTGGTIKGNGLAFVHDKERVLTDEQNLYFEKLISKIPVLLKAIDITKFNGNSGFNSIGLNKTLSNVASTVINKVECIFPAITSTDGLQRAILELPKLALQTK